MLDLHPGIGIFSQRKMDADKTLYPNAKERIENKNKRAVYISKVKKLEKERIKLLKDNN
jgi:hypothetical protein